jgi:hypothetical protein
VLTLTIFWAAGMPLFRWYGFAWACMIAFLAKITGFNFDFSFIIVFLASIATTGITSYLIIGDLTDNDRVTSLIAAFITVTCAQTKSLFKLRIYLYKCSTYA